MYNRTNYNTIFKNNNIKEIPIFKTNKTLINYINLKLKNDIKENIIHNKNNENSIKHNFIYHKKNLNYIKNENSGKNYYNDDLIMNLKKIMNYNNKNTKNKRNKSLKNEFKYSLSMSLGVPYRKVGKIISRNECQFSKNKKINNIKHDLKKSKSCNLLKELTLNNKSIDEIKKLQGENYFLKKMIRLSEKKFKAKKGELEKILMLENLGDQSEERKCPTPMEKINQIKFKEENKNINLINANKIYNLIKGYLDEPKVQVAPIPYSINQK